MITLTTEQAQQIEEVLEELCGSIDFYNKYGPDWTHKDGTESFNVSVLLDRADDISKAIIALREALAEQAEQEPVKRFTSDDVKVAFENGYAAAMSVADIAKEVEQEPVAYTNSDQLGYLKDHLYENAPMAMWSKPFDERINVPLYAAPVQQAEQEPVAIADGTFNHNCPLGTPLYAAPVRTKDLTDEEVDEIPFNRVSDDPLLEYARAVIAAYKAKQP